MLGLLLGGLTVSAQTDPKIVYFEQKVRPILEAHCIKCHGGEAKVKGGLRLTSQAGIIQGGETGPAVNLQEPGKSLLLKAILYDDEDLQMPPKGEKLPAEKIAVLTKWVEMGAPHPVAGEAVASTPRHAPPKVTEETKKFWSFVPVKRPAIPRVEGAGANPIDHFILARLAASGLKATGPASKQALIRRAYYDLTGLPPRPDEVDGFVADHSPDAFEKVIDRLLASPQYGEKWGRHWLDVVRFAETNSFERDGIKPNAWRYRDYVIESFNQDKPYDQFVREQIAGDEFVPPTHASIIATGIYRLGPWDDEPSDKLQAKYDELDDVVTTIGQGFLGLTMNCARCHDHKIDPVSLRDYYSFLAFFNNIAPYQKDGPNTMTEILPPDQQKAYEEEKLALQARKEDVRKRIDHFERPVLKALAVSEKVDIDKPRKREALLEEKILAATNADELRHYKELKKELKELESRKDKDTPRALSAKELSTKPVETFVLKRGNPTNQGERVTAGFPEVLSPPKVTLTTPTPGQKSTGLRTQLANWLTDAKNPLVARVMVNRIWQHHFGRGIVRSPNDFGFGGDKPTHPELLDYLANDFVANGWSMKKMHKQIMLSAAYQRSSLAIEENLAKDPNNDLLWRFDMRRLTAEEVRDSILAVTGKLNLKMGGPGIFPKIPDVIMAGQSRPGEGWGKSSPEETSRRSVYIHVKRSLVVPLISAFDGPDTDFSCPARFTTTQSTQALLMINSEMMQEEARALAARLRREHPDNPPAQVERALNLALSRRPTPAEIERSVSFIKTMRAEHRLDRDAALSQFALLVLNLNELMYLD